MSENTELNSDIKNKKDFDQEILSIPPENSNNPQNDKTLCDAIVSGETDDLDAKVDKAIKQAEYKAWATELSVIKRKQSAKELADEIIGGV